MIIFFILIIIISAIIHEVSHGLMADHLGDPTARYAGRLSLNPMVHIDLFGSVILPLLLIPTGFLFAYAKPVPYNPYNLRNQKWGPAMVAAAGPASNLLLALVFGLIIQYAPVPGTMISFLATIVYANILLAVFNLVPIPPLDGSKVLFAVLPSSLAQFKIALERYGFALLLIFVFFFSPVLLPIIRFIYSLFTGGASLF